MNFILREPKKSNEVFHDFTMQINQNKNIKLPSAS